MPSHERCATGRVSIYQAPKFTATTTASAMIALIRIKLQTLTQGTRSKRQCRGYRRPIWRYLDRSAPGIWYRDYHFQRMENQGYRWGNDVRFPAYQETLQYWWLTYIVIKWTKRIGMMLCYQ